MTVEGPVPPGEYLLLVVPGPAQVKASALSGAIQPGTLLSSSGEAGYAAEAALAQTSPGYNLEWHVVGGGGRPISSAHYLVNSTAGQDAASPPFSSGAHYAVSGGYWFRPSCAVHLPVVLRDYP
jgi:hypothetical protein